MTLVVAKVEFEGPFFTRNPAKTFRQNVNALMERVIAWGEADIRQRLAGIGTGRTRATYRGKIHRIGRIGRASWDIEVRLAPRTAGFGAKEAISLMAASHEMELGHTPGRTIHAKLGRGPGGRHGVRDSAKALRRFTPEIQNTLMDGIG